MNFSVVVAIIMSLAVFAFGLMLSTDDLKMFYDFPSVFIVFGGTASAAALSFQYKRLWVLFKLFLSRVFKGRGFIYSDIIKEVLVVLDAYRKGESLKSLADKSEDLFLKEGLQLMDGGVLTLDQVIKVMEERNENLYFLYQEDAIKVKTLGKYPPAFGMMGTTIGMIVLLANLSGTDAIKKVGPAMGVALITTLYGVVLANFGFLPFSDNMVEQAKEMYLKNRILIESFKLIAEKSNPIIAAEILNSFLRPSDRLDWKTVLNGGR
jgi:chemotaxis protein MotA